MGLTETLRCWKQPNDLGAIPNITEEQTHTTEVYFRSPQLGDRQKGGGGGGGGERESNEGIGTMVRKIKGSWQQK